MTIRGLALDRRVPKLKCSISKQGGRCATIFDVGDTIRAKGIAYAVAGHFFDHAKSLGNASPNANTFAYVFDRGGTALAAVFAASKENMMQRTSLTLALAPGQFNAYDPMGNELPANSSTVVYGRQPVYIEGVAGLSIERSERRSPKVQAKNASGNVSAVVNREFTVVESGEMSPEHGNHACLERRSWRLFDRSISEPFPVSSLLSTSSARWLSVASFPRRLHGSANSSPRHDLGSRK